MLPLLCCRIMNFDWGCDACLSVHIALNNDNIVGRTNSDCEYHNAVPAKNKRLQNKTKENKKRRTHITIYHITINDSDGDFASLVAVAKTVATLDKQIN